MICWSCQKQAGAGPLCAACGALQPPDDAADLFAVLGLPERYAVDLSAFNQEGGDVVYKPRERSTGELLFPDAS